jgi:hypothetical protein
MAHVRRHSSGTGWSYRKSIPRHLRGAFGKAHFNRYISDAQAPGKREADRLGARFSIEDDATVQVVKAMPEGDRKDFIAAGGLTAIRQQLPALEFQRNIARALVEVGNTMNPIEAAAEEGLPLATVISDMLVTREELQARTAHVAKLQHLVAAADGKPRQLGNGMRDLFDLWCKRPLKKTRQAPKRTADHKASVDRFITVCGNLSVREITSDHIRAFYRQNEAEKLGPAAQVKHRDQGVAGLGSL